ncbi:hypothetical protein KP509_23G028000 [Ceratopteris richardii]|uniref:RING-type domain-containing protein n=1 Tax=Ceratopteris richardii TaxID=49495 RepID=A0A8T2S0V1_CERRI|nr:hypothetical protein KP509_23G028000 [Ceratopteris richardii]
MRKSSRVKVMVENKRKVSERELAVSWPRQQRAYERLTRMQGASIEEQDVFTVKHGAGDRTRQADHGDAVPKDFKWTTEEKRAKVIRRMASVQRMVREGMPRMTYEELRGVRNAAKALFQEIDLAMDNAKEAEETAATRRLEEQETTIRWLELGHAIFEEQKEGMEEKHSAERQELRRQLLEEREKALCLVCLERPRNTLVLPCLHFQYCLDCLLQHRSCNGNTCPTCRRSIEGLCMASSLAASSPAT